jgi:hypothetical protein
MFLRAAKFRATGRDKSMDTLVINHCALCGVEVEPEDEYCCQCLREINNLDHCPCCGQIICNCEVGDGD